MTDEPCPQCGFDTETIIDGVCEECRAENQASLDLHNAEYDRWKKMTQPQRDAAIKEAGR